MEKEVLNLKSLDKKDVPDDLSYKSYFDFKTHPFDHETLFRETNSVYTAIIGIKNYAADWLEKTIKEKRNRAASYKNQTPKPAQTFGKFEVILEDGAVFEPSKVMGSNNGSAGSIIFLEKGAKVFGSDIYLDEGHIYIAAGTTVEPGVGIKGPTIIGKKNEIRQGAYLRGSCILGNECTIRGEMKNIVMMDKSNFPHPSYIGDSLCGFMTHFGNQATAANLGIYEGIREPQNRKPIIVKCNGKYYDLGKPKMGICMGDFSQVGCNSVSDPGTFLKPYTIAYSLTRISKGFYGPNEVLKNKPMEHGIVERANLTPLS
ncbi:MAG: hypothetical protein ABIA63_12870 [bacterium]